MRIQNPTITQIAELKGDGAQLTGSFSGSFTDWNGVQAKPDNLFSGSAQLNTIPDVAATISGSFTLTSASIATDIKALEDFSSSLDSGFVTEAELVAATASLSSSLATDIATNTNNITSLDGEVSNLMAATGSQYAHIANIHSFTSSNAATDTVQSAHIGNIHTYTGSLKSAISVAGSNLTVFGDLTVQGTKTELQVSTLNVEDLNITVASGSATAAAANGAGLTVDGANATLTYASTGDKWVSNKVFDVPTDGLLINGTAVTSTAAELNLLDGSSAGTVVNSKGVIYSAGGKVNATQFQIGGVDVDNDIATLSVPANTTISAFGATLVDDADAATARTTLGLGTAATTNSTAYATAAQGTTADAALPKSGGQMTGNITFSGAQTVDGRDLSVDGAKLDGIAAGATNVTNNNQLTNGAGYTTYSANQTLDNTSNVHFEGLMVGQTTGATANTIRCVGDIVAYYSSDAQFKDNVETLEGALDKVKAIRGVRFDWNDKQDVFEGHDIGVIAQEVQAVLPELVHHREHSDSLAVDYVKLTAVLIEAVKELSAKVDELSK